jgi:hypothetical protein
MKPFFAATVAALAVLGACTRAAPPPQSIQDIMSTIVDPAADALWDSVSSETTNDGIEEKQPRSDAEWRAVRAHAVTLVEASRLLAAEHRPVTHGGKQVEDAHVPGILPAHEIESAIKTDRTGFEARARELQDAACQALNAIEAKSPARLLAAGGAIDQACERCHQAYWYPNAERPAEKWPAPLKAASQP